MNNVYLDLDNVNKWTTVGRTNNIKTHTPPAITYTIHMHNIRMFSRLRDIYRGLKNWTAAWRYTRTNLFYMNSCVHRLQPTFQRSRRVKSKVWYIMFTAFICLGRRCPTKHSITHLKKKNTLSCLSSFRYGAFR